MDEGSESAAPMIYEIKIEGRLSDRWTDWFEGLTFTYGDDNSTTLHGPLADQAALHGILNHIRDLGLVLISAHRVDAGGNRREQDGKQNEVAKTPGN